jgi:hypothetical protein
MVEGRNEKERQVGHESQERQAAEHPGKTGLLVFASVGPIIRRFGPTSKRKCGLIIVMDHHGGI